MIENLNVIHDLKIKRTVHYSEDFKQINILDQRFYRKDNKYYPSVSSILNYFPKNKYFHDWLRDVGWNSEIIVQKAAYEGKLVHTCIENFLLGKEVKWINHNEEAEYPLEVWKMVLKFAEFWNTYKPELIASEYHVFSDKYEYAGTIDLVCKLKGKIWLLDIKTSNSLHTSYDLQLAAYAEAWNETHSDKIEEIGILWLKAATRGPDKKGEKIQGAGWQLKIPDHNLTDLFKIFTYIYEIYKIENNDFKPYIESLPTSIKLEE